MVVYWLLLIIYGASVPVVHVGNFKSYDSCLSAARGGQTYNPGNVITHPIFMCIQANESGTSPPQ